MGSYNYEALHKHTPGIKRAWMPDPLPTNRGGHMNNGMRVVQEPYPNGLRAVQDPYANGLRAVQDPYANGLRAVQDPYANGLRAVQEPYTNGLRAVQDPYANGLRAVQDPYANGLRAVQEPYTNGLRAVQDPYANGLRAVQEPYANGLRAVQDPYLNASMRAVHEPYANGYGDALQDRILLAQAAQAAQVQAQAQLLNGVSHYGLTKYNLPVDPPLPLGLLAPDHLMDTMGDRDRYASTVYGNGLQPLRRPLYPPAREPRRGARRERRLQEPLAREPDPIRELSTSQSPAHIPDAIAEPPLAGMVFGCTSDTYIECMQLKLFALPAANKAEVLRVAPGTKLFLYNYRARELSGIFEATSHGDVDIEPDAFQGFFPAQVRIRCVEKCPNLPLKAFKEAMSENFEKQNKFKYSLNDVQVRKLVTLFRQELKYWQKQRAQQERKILASGLQPGLRPGYPSRTEVNLNRQLQGDPYASKRIRIN